MCTWVRRGPSVPSPPVAHGTSVSVERAVATTTRQRARRRSPGSRRSRRSRGARLSLPTRVRGGLATILGRQADDVWGVVFLVAAALAALGIYGDLTGPAGQAAKTGTGDVFGWGRFLVPPALALLGATLVRG